MGKKKPRGNLPRCPDCNDQVPDKNLAKKVKGRWVCEPCQELRAIEEEDRQILYGYVGELFEMDFPAIWMLSQIKEFKEKHKYTYRGMELSLRYWNDTLGNDMSNAKGVGIIPYIYNDARKHFIQKMDINNKLADMEEPFTTERRITVSRKDMNSSSEKNNKKLIDMNDL